jgi:hypothetical protein
LVVAESCSGVPVEVFALDGLDGIGREEGLAGEAVGEVSDPPAGLGVETTRSGVAEAGGLLIATLVIGVEPWWRVARQHDM